MSDRQNVTAANALLDVHEQIVGTSVEKGVLQDVIQLLCEEISPGARETVKSRFSPMFRKRDGENAAPEEEDDTDELIEETVDEEEECPCPQSNSTSQNEKKNIPAYGSAKYRLLHASHPLVKELLKSVNVKNAFVVYNGERKALTDLACVDISYVPKWIEGRCEKSIDKRMYECAARLLLSQYGSVEDIVSTYEDVIERKDAFLRVH